MEEEKKEGKKEESEKEEGEEDQSIEGLRTPVNHPMHLVNVPGCYSYRQRSVTVTHMCMM